MREERQLCDSSATYHPNPEPCTPLLPPHSARDRKGLYSWGTFLIPRLHVTPGGPAQARVTTV